MILDSPACHTTLVLLVDGLARFTFKDAQASVQDRLQLGPTKGGVMQLPVPAAGMQASCHSPCNMAWWPQHGQA